MRYTSNYAITSSYSCTLSTKSKMEREDYTDFFVYLAPIAREVRRIERKPILLRSWSSQKGLIKRMAISAASKKKPR